MDDKLKLAFAKAMHQIVLAVLRDEMSLETAAGRLESGAKWLKGVEQGKPEKKEDEPAGPKVPRAEIVAVYEHWKQATNRPKAQLTRMRSTKIRLALEAGFTPDQLKHITVWSANDPGTQGANRTGLRYDKIENMFTNVERIEGLLEQSGWHDRQERRGEAPVVDLDVARRCRELDDQATKELKGGNIERYNDLQAELRRLTGSADEAERGADNEAIRPNDRPGRKGSNGG